MPPSFKNFLVIVLFSLFTVTGCVGPGVYHKVGKGETLWRISKTYGVDIQDVAELNDIRDPAEISAGRLLYIPGVSQVRKVKPYVPPSRKKTAKAPVEVEKEEPEGRIMIQRDRFLWPVSGKVISNFGMRNGTRHGGIDIKAAEGVPVKAADSGEVAYIDSDMRGYGKIVILKHVDGFFTVYAHNKENLVKMGEKVEKGASIATVGRSGNATTTHLHFEVRFGKTVRNPLFFLP
jgi:lipoprotein NlpD